MDYQDFALVQQQCENQYATEPRDFMGMTAAYMNAQFMLALTSQYQEVVRPNWLLSVILTWGYMVDDRNETGWRRVGVRVGNDTKLNHEFIDVEIRDLMEMVVAKTLTPTEVYERFENIHPFIDGNGRVGHILWAWYTVYFGGEWPQTLPPDVFNQGIVGAASLDPDGTEDKQYV